MADSNLTSLLNCAQREDIITVVNMCYFYGQVLCELSAHAQIPPVNWENVNTQLDYYCGARKRKM